MQSVVLTQETAPKALTLGGGEMSFVLTEELSANIAARNAAGWEACLDRLQGGAEKEPWVSGVAGSVGRLTIGVVGAARGPRCSSTTSEAAPSAVRSAAVVATLTSLALA